MSDATQLLPCPFCGDKDALHNRRGEDDHGWDVWCSTCYGETWADTRDEAIAKWNTRAPYAEREALRAATLERLAAAILDENHVAMIARAERAEAELAAKDARIVELSEGCERIICEREDARAELAEARAKIERMQELLVDARKEIELLAAAPVVRGSTSRVLDAIEALAKEQPR